MLPFIPTPNLGKNEFSSGADKQRLNDDKGSARTDINTSRYGTFSAYYFADNYNLDDPYPSGFGGATLPGPNGAYDPLSSGRDQMIVLSHAKTLGSNLVNEARAGYVRLSNQLGVPKGGVGVTLAEQGISSGTEGIKQGFPQYAGVEMLYFNSFAVGTNPFFVAQVNITLDLGDTLSKVAGNHTLKFGGEYIGYQVKQAPDLVANGILLPFVLIFMLRLVNRDDLMGKYKNSRFFNNIAWVTCVVMIVLTLLLVVTTLFPKKLPT